MYLMQIYDITSSSMGVGQVMKVQTLVKHTLSVHVSHAHKNPCNASFNNQVQYWSALRLTEQSLQR